MGQQRDPGPELLRRLEQRLEQASARAQRLSDAAAQAEPPPPAGFQLPGEDARESDQLDALLATLHALRELIPPELQRRLADALRELLLAVRALLDWQIERLERGGEAPGEVEDIPIL